MRDLTVRLRRLMGAGRVVAPRPSGGTGDTAANAREHVGLRPRELLQRLGHGHARLDAKEGDGGDGASERVAEYAHEAAAPLVVGLLVNGGVVAPRPGPVSGRRRPLWMRVVAAQELAADSAGRQGA